MELLDGMLIFVILLNVCLLDGQLQSSCRYFDFRTDKSGYTYGFIKIEFSGPVSTVTTTINYTIAAPTYTKSAGSLEYLGLKDSVVTYKVHFPIQQPTPKITRLVTNSHILCEAPGDDLESSNYVSTFGLSHQVTFGSRYTSYRLQPTRPVNTFPDNNFNVISSNKDMMNLNPGFSQFELGPWRVQPSDMSRRRTPVRPRVTERPATENPWNTPSEASYRTTTNRPEYKSRQRAPPAPPRQPQTEMPVYKSSPREIPTTPRPRVTEKPLPVQRVPTSPPLPPRPEYALQSENSEECGIAPNAPSIAPLIFQGDSFEAGEWPWLVALYLGKGGSLQYICAGSLVSDMHVVTAAHCMQLRTLNSHKDVIVRAGVHNLEEWGDENSITRTIASARIHESYTAQNLANDILVLQFTKKIKFSPYIRPICLWDGNNDQDKVVGKFGVVAGWGDSEYSRSGRGEPRMVRLKIVSTTTCRNSKPDFEMLTSSYTLCAGERNGAGPCFGDSGAGMYLREGGRWKLRGIVSLSLPKDDGEYNCNLEEYLVFTDTAQYLPWITDSMISNKN